MAEWTETDVLIAEYANVLEGIYDARTAGDSTFAGVLAEFARKVIKTGAPNNRTYVEPADPAGYDW